MAMIKENIESVLTFSNTNNISILRFTESDEGNHLNLSIENDVYKLNFPITINNDQDEIKAIIKLLEDYIEP